ncbi:MAG: hypothetical protein KDD38_01705 [Bdellovibrionales bacterium]|nr:hypothetical protein [Bdellovibrionales bacterium]
MKFKFEESHNSLDVELSGDRGEELKLILWGLLENALKKVGRTREEFKGLISIESTLPLGAGLGASAALCVGFGQIFSYLGWIEDKNIYEFSRELEGLFHGESSGVDIAIALEGVGLRFMRGGERTSLIQQWSPPLYLSYSGKRGVTSDCVKKVMALHSRSAGLGEKVDAQMREAVELAEKSLAMNRENGFTLLAQSLDKARDCFYQWELCDGALDQHMRELSQAGAYAVKPTGSGGGGYVLSLWQNEPPADLRANMISLF